MKDLAADRIRNVCLMAHGGAGKTTLAEAMLYNTGVLERFGRVEDGTPLQITILRKSKERAQSARLFAHVNGKTTKLT